MIEPFDFPGERIEKAVQLVQEALIECAQDTDAPWVALLIHSPGTPGDDPWARACRMLSRFSYAELALLRDSITSFGWLCSIEATALVDHEGNKIEHLVVRGKQVAMPPVGLRAAPPYDRTGAFAADVARRTVAEFVNNGLERLQEEARRARPQMLNTHPTCNALFSEGSHGGGYTCRLPQGHDGAHRA